MLTAQEARERSESIAKLRFLSKWEDKIFSQTEIGAFELVIHDSLDSLQKAAFVELGYNVSETKAIDDVYTTISW